MGLHKKVNSAQVHAGGQGGGPRNRSDWTEKSLSRSLSVQQYGSSREAARSLAYNCPLLPLSLLFKFENLTYRWVSFGCGL